MWQRCLGGSSPTSLVTAWVQLRSEASPRSGKWPDDAACCFASDAIDPSVAAQITGLEQASQK